VNASCFTIVSPEFGNSHDDTWGTEEDKGLPQIQVLPTMIHKRSKEVDEAKP
jgi:hypothetical protein